MNPLFRARRREVPRRKRINNLGLWILSVLFIYHEPLFVDHLVPAWITRRPPDEFLGSPTHGALPKKTCVQTPILSFDLVSTSNARHTRFGRPKPGSSAGETKLRQKLEPISSSNYAGGAWTDASRCLHSAVVYLRTIFVNPWMTKLTAVGARRQKVDRQYWCFVLKLFFCVNRRLRLFVGDLDLRLLMIPFLIATTWAGGCVIGASRSSLFVFCTRPFSSLVSDYSPWFNEAHRGNSL